MSVVVRTAHTAFASPPQTRSTSLAESASLHERHEVIEFREVNDGGPGLVFATLLFAHEVWRSERCA
jgi:hypothetical protein